VLGGKLECGTSPRGTPPRDTLPRDTLPRDKLPQMTAGSEAVYGRLPERSREGLGV
jgi:hypothetical protein